MKKTIKWAAVIGGGIVGLFLLAIILIPMFVSVENYKPYIEKKVTELTGRPTTVKGDLRLSLFPWVGISFSDLHMGNGPGFKEGDLLVVKSFEVRVKLLPLLRKDVQVKRFVLEGPRLVLIKNKNGRTNWEGPAKAAPTPQGAPSGKEAKPPEGKTPGSALPIRALAVGEFAIKDGTVVYIDEAANSRREIKDLNLTLDDVSFDRPIRLVFSASVDGHPLSMEGKMGPVGKNPGMGTVPMNISLKALEQINLSLVGQVKDPAVNPQFDLNLQISPFSPRKAMSELGAPLSVKTANPDALNRLALKANIKGGTKSVSISEGELVLDETTMKFSTTARDFSKPDVTFALQADQIDLDGYLPPKEEKAAGKQSKETEKAPAGPAKKSPAESTKKDYASLRRVVLKGAVTIGKLKASGAKMEDFSMKMSGKNGLFQLDPLEAKLYGGEMGAKGSLDVRQDVPRIGLTFSGKKLQAGPLLKDVLNKDVIEGDLQADVSVNAVGDDAEKIKGSLNGTGDLLFKDGAIKGIDLPGMIRNVEAAFGLKEKQAEQPRTDFSELHVPFTLKEGVFVTKETTLVSPLLRVNAAGEANLRNEKLDFRIEPKLVATLKGQGDASKRSGINIPVLVTGSFSSPKFRPDVKGMLGEPGVKEMIENPDKLKERSKQLEKNLKDLIKGFGGSQ